MRGMNRRELLGGAAMLAVPAAAAAQGAAPAPAPPRRPRSPIVKGTLSQGATVLCRSNTASEIVAVLALVRAGLHDEAERQAGLAAVTAEALLGGTRTRSGPIFLAAVAQAGGNMRTLPGFDFTEVAIVATRDQYELSLKLVADVVCHPAFTEEGVRVAREAVKRRALSVQDDFTGASYQTLTSQLYPQSPYGRPISGYPDTLDRITAADVRGFWERNYVQSRVTVAVVGDIDASTAIGTAQAAFKDMPATPPPAPVRPPENVLARPRVEFIQRSGPASQVMAGFLAPGATRENYPVYSLLDAVIGGGKRARLFRNIREKHSLGYSLGSFYQPLLYQSHLVGYVITPAQRTNPRTEQAEGVIDLVKTHLLAQYREVAAAGPTPEELARAKSYLLGRYALKQERTRDQARNLAWNWAMGLGLDFDPYFNDRVATISKEQVQAAARRIVDQYALVVTLQDQRPEE